MARALTSAELELLRSDAQFTRLYLAVHQPNTIYTALLNGVPVENDEVYQITFDNGAGTLGDVKAGMTLYVGTSAGAYDLGMCRIRKAPIAGTFYIGITSEIVWADNCFLTVVDDFDLWAKHATITGGVLSMDVDIAYSNQHSAFNPVPIMGPHAVAWLDGASVEVRFDSSDSWVFDSTISSRSWSAPGSSASSGMTGNTPIITYNAAGMYRVFCTVTAANGKSTTGVRHVFVYDRVNHPPFTVFQLAQCVGDYNTGGWMFDMEMQAEASLSEIRDRALVVLFAEDWYGTTKQSIGPLANRENIVCMGRIVGESIRWDRETGRVHFTVQGAHHWLNKIKAFPVEMYFANDTPDSWSLMPTMTVDRAIWHILYWHSTVIETMDFYKTGDARYINEGKTLASTLWGQVQDIAISRILASGGVDRFGRLYLQIDPQMIPAASRTWPTVMTLTDADFSEGIDFQRRIVDDVSLVTLTSQLVDASGAVSVLYSLSPGHVPRRYGEPEQADRLAAASQALSNQMAGLLLGWRINPYPEMPMSLAANNRMIDMWPQQFCALQVQSTDTPREVAFNDNLIPRRVSLYFDGDAGWMHAELDCEAETFEQPNTNGDIPDVDDASVPPFPPISIPPLPPLDPGYPGDPSSTPDGPPTVVILDEDLGFLYSVNFDSSSPTWQFWNTGIVSGDKPYIDYFFACPSGAYYAFVRETGYQRFHNIVYRASALGGTWVKVLDQTILDGMEGAGSGIMGVGRNQTKYEEVALIIGANLLGSPSTMHFWLGSNTTWVQKTSFSFVSNFMGGMTFGANKWVWDAQTAANEYWKRFNADGSTLEYTSTGFGQGHMIWTVRAGTSSLIFKSKPGVTGLEGLLRSANNGDTWDVIDLNPNGLEGNLAVSSNGGVLFGNWDPGGGNRGKSLDGGYTWSGGFFVPGGAYCFAYCGGVSTSSKWILARGYVRFSPNAGGDWIAKEGNLPYLIPTNMRIIKIVVPGVY